MSGGGSIVVRRQLGRELRALRTRSHRSREDVAASGIASVAKLARIEGGQTPVRPGDVRELCRLYEADEATTDRLATMAHATRAPSWWEEADFSAPRWYAMYLNLEAVASDLFAYEPMVIHGLFQTAGYLRALGRITVHDFEKAMTEQYVAARMARQRSVFTRADPLRIHLVLGEAAFATPVGDAEIQAAQLDLLRERAALPQVEIRVLPFAAGPHPGIHGPFSVLELAHPEDPPVAYVETYDAARYPELPIHVAQYRRRFTLLNEMSIPLEEWLR